MGRSEATRSAEKDLERHRNEDPEEQTRYWKRDEEMAQAKAIKKGARDRHEGAQDRLGPGRHTLAGHAHGVNAPSPSEARGGHRQAEQGARGAGQT